MEDGEVDREGVGAGVIGEERTAPLEVGASPLVTAEPPGAARRVGRRAEGDIIVVAIYTLHYLLCNQAPTHVSLHTHKPAICLLRSVNGDSSSL